MGKSQNSSHGIGFMGMLAIAFIVLRLTGHIGWSWWWVLSPLWLPIGVVVAILLAGLALARIATLVGAK